MSVENNNSPETPSTPPPPPARKARKFVLPALLLLAVTSLLYVLKYPTAFRHSDSDHSHTGEKTDFYCPMHPTYHSDKPGNCPICGMKFVKVEKAPSSDASKSETQAMPGTQSDTAAAASQPVTSIYIAPQKQQLIGMRTVTVSVQPLTKEIRAAGKVAVDETRVTHIHTKVSGYIEDVFANFIGKPVRRGEPLFTIYSPDLVSTQQEYLLALKSRNVLTKSAFPDVARGSDNLLAATRERLRLFDISEEEIKRLESNGTAKRAISVASPVDGIVTSRAAYHHGTFVTPEMELFTIVDLSTVWVLGEVYEFELPFVRVGQSAEVTLPYGTSQRSLYGRVSFITPFVDPKTRTAQVRIEFPNPGLTLKPESFTNVLLRSNLGQVLVVPQDAVLNTGVEQYVFLDLGQGYVEPRRVEISAAAGDNYGISKGLKPGDRVVTAANFILDAESRLKGAFANMGAASQVSIEGPPVDRQDLSITLTEPQQAKVGANSVRLRIQDPSGKPVDGVDTEISVFMPQMGSMAPMSAKGALKSLGGGEYAGTIEIPMAWTWQTTITVRRNGQVIGTKHLNLTAR